MAARLIQVGDRLTDNQVYDIHIARVYLGGFGIVAVGSDAARDDEAVALKMPHPAFLRSKRFVQLFERECLTWIGIWPHSNVVKARYLLDLSGFRVLALNYASQGTLRRHLRQPVPLEQALLWAEHIACGLSHIHTPDPDHMRPQPIVHRDLKPENILINARGFALITDFGLAKAFVEASDETSDLLTQSEGFTVKDETSVVHDAKSHLIKTQRGAVFGTAAYMGFEQWEDAASVGPPTDLYALGIVLSELLAHRHPLVDELSAKTLTAADWRLLHQNPHPQGLRDVQPSLSHSVEELYLACLAPDPRLRPTSVEALEVLRLAVHSQASEGDDAQVAAERTPDNEFRFWHNWSSAYVGVDRFSEALSRNDRALQVKPASTAAWLTRGNALRSMNQLDEAQAAYMRVLELAQPGDMEAILKTKHGMGQLYTRQNRFAEADAIISEELAIDERNPNVWQARSNNQLMWAKSWIRAHDYVRAREHIELGLVYHSKSISGDWRPRNAEAQQCYLLGELGNILKYERRFAEAEEVYTQAFKAVEGVYEPPPGIRIVWLNRAINQRMWAESLMGSDSAFAEAHIDRGLKYLESSAHIAREAYGTDDSAGDRLRVDLLFLRGRIASTQGHHPEAEAIYTTALAILQGLPEPKPLVGIKIVIQQAANYKLWGEKEAHNQCGEEALLCFQRGLGTLESLPAAELTSQEVVELQMQLALLKLEMQSRQGDAN